MYKHIVNDRDFVLTLFFVIPEYVVLVLLQVFRQILIIAVENQHWVDLMNYIINPLHLLDLLIVLIKSLF